MIYLQKIELKINYVCTNGFKWLLKINERYLEYYFNNICYLHKPD